MIKGLEALVIESYTTARKYGVEDHVLPTLAETFPSIDWPKQGAYFFSRVVQHGKRRAEEMREAANTVAEAGFEPFMREYPNVWSKVSCPERLSVTGPPALDGERNAYRDVVPFARRIVETFPDRVLWGTDWPHPNLKNHMPDDGLLVDFIPHIAATAELQRKLLVDNPNRLYWADEIEGG